MNVAEAQRRVLIKRILMRMIDKGRVPSVVELANELESETANLRGSQSLAWQRARSVHLLEASSASKMRATSLDVVDDLDALLDFLLTSEQNIIRSNARTLSKLELLNTRAAAVMNGLDGLLLLNSKTDGYISAFADDFSTSEYIDHTATTAVYDTTSQSVSLPVLNPNNSSGGVDLSRILPGDVQLSPMDARLSLAPGIRDSSTLSLFGPGSLIYTVSSTSPIEAPISLQVDLQRAAAGLELEFNRIRLAMSPGPTSYGLILQTSHDGIVWDRVDDVPQQSVSRGALLSFTNLRVRYVRFLISARHYSRIDARGRYLYDFVFSDLGIYRNNRSSVPDAVLLTTHLQAQNVDRASAIEQVAIESCALLPTGTSIKYDVAFVDQTDVVGDFRPIAPLNDERGGSVVSFTESNWSNQLALVDSTRRVFEGADDGDSWVLKAEIDRTKRTRIWRNIGDRARYYLVRQSDFTLVEDGWFYDGTHYSCYFLVGQDHQEFDLGPRRAEVDGVTRQGLVRLSRGVHSFRTPHRNWLSLRGLHDVVDFDPATKRFSGKQHTFEGAVEGQDQVTLESGGTIDADYRVVDPLYPYNHKLVIEGLSVSALLGDSEVSRSYQGATRYAGALLQEVPSSSLKQTVDREDMYHFSVVGGLDDTSAIRGYIAVKKVLLIDTPPREQYLIEQRSLDAAAKAVVIRARLSTEDPRVTPVLHGYVVKLDLAD